MRKQRSKSSVKLTSETKSILALAPTVKSTPDRMKGVLSFKDPSSSQAALENQTKKRLSHRFLDRISEDVLHIVHDRMRIPVPDADLNLSSKVKGDSAEQVQLGQEAALEGYNLSVILQE